MSNLPKRYAYAVTQCLPQNQREEVTKELLATIEDMAADRAEKGKPTEADYKAVLQELGDPIALARKYTTTNRYLIGPKWYDTYLKFLITLVSTVPFIVAAIVSIIAIAQGNQSIIQSVLQAVGSGVTAAIHICFWVTAVFAILERTVKPDQLSAAWSPDDLPEVPKYPTRQIGIAESAVSAGFLVLVGVWVALQPIIHVKNGETLFNNIGGEWVVMFFGLITLAFLHDLWKLKVGNWTTPITVTSVVLAAATIVYLLALAGTQELINPEFFRAWGVTSSVEEITRVINWSVGITVAAIVISEIAESIQAVIMNRRLKNRSAA